MVKRNRKQTKKRIKKYLLKRGKEATKTVVIKEVPHKEVGLELYVGKYAKENEEYQGALDKVYGGVVIPVERYTNPRCIILHTCTQCHQEFYSRPSWLLVKPNQRHVCGLLAKSVVKNIDKQRTSLNKEEELELYELFKVGMSISKIAKRYDVTKYTVNKYLRMAGLKL